MVPTGNEYCSPWKHFLSQPVFRMKETHSVWTEGERHLLWPRWEAFPEGQTSAKRPSPAVVKQHGAPAPPLHTLYWPSSGFYKQARGKHLGSRCRFLHLPMRKTYLSKHRMVPIYSETKMFFYAESYSNSKPNSYPHHWEFFPLCMCVPTLSVIPQMSSIFPLGCGLSWAWSSPKGARQAGQRTPGVLLSLTPRARIISMPH